MKLNKQDLLALFHTFRDNLKALRDAKVMEVIEGSTEIQQITIPRLAFSGLQVCKAGNIIRRVMEERSWLQLRGR